MAECVRLYYDGYLMNTIEPSSKFKSIPNARCDTAEGREKVARRLMEGWIRNAGYHRHLFRIEHGKTDPLVLSRMTSEIMQKWSVKCVEF